MRKITEAFKLKYDNIFAKLMNISVDELHFDKLKINESICVNENARQKHSTPESICKQMIDLYSFNDSDKILVLFNLELVKELIGRKVKKENIYFVSDYSSKSDFLSKYFKEINYINLNEYTLNDLEEKIKSFNVKKFDVVFSNPPYDGSLHLKLMDGIIKFSNKIIWISPVRWLQDPLAKYKNKSDYFKYENSISKHIEKLIIIKALNAQQYFLNTVMNIDLAIYSINTQVESNFNYKELSVNTILDKFLKFITNNIPIFDNNMYKGVRVRIPIIIGGKSNGSGKRENWNGIVTLGKLLYFIDGYKENKPWYEWYRKNQHSKTTLEITRSIKFNSELEANNFINQYKTNFVTYITHNLLSDVHVSPQQIVWMNNVINPRTNKKGYLSEWTDEDFYKFFNLSSEEINEIETFDYKSN